MPRHAKNLSVYQAPGKGVTLTPFYDLLCTRLYPGLSPDFAFLIGGETKPGAIAASHITLMAEQLRVSPQFVLKQAQNLAMKVPAALDQAMQSVSPVLSSSAKILVNRLKQFVLSTTKRTAERMIP